MDDGDGGGPSYTSGSRHPSRLVGINEIEEEEDDYEQYHEGKSYGEVSPQPKTKTFMVKGSVPNVNKPQ